jgi:hypothetical protein
MILDDDMEIVDLVDHPVWETLQDGVNDGFELGAIHPGIESRTGRVWVRS